MTSNHEDLLSVKQDVDLKLINCCWCGSLSFPAFKDKKYCSYCHSKCFRECKRCKKPFPNQSYFLQDALFCNSCFMQKKNQKSCYFKRKEMEKCILKHFQNLETLERYSLVDNIKTSSHIQQPVKQPRRSRRRKNQNK